MRLSILRRALRVITLALAVSAWAVSSDPVDAQAVKTIAESTLEEPNQKTPEVSTDELRRILTDGSAVVFDARPPKEYALSHIPGAVNVNGIPGRPMSQYVPDAAEVAGARW